MRSLAIGKGLKNHVFLITAIWTLLSAILVLATVSTSSRSDNLSLEPELRPESSSVLKTVRLDSPTGFPTEELTEKAKGYYVSPAGSDSNTGTTAESAWQSIQKALDLAKSGDTINLAPGEYFQDLISKMAGEAERPITITGPKEAVIKGAGKSRVVEVNHSYITLDGFTIDGLSGGELSRASYRDKLVYLIGKEPNVGVRGVRILNMTLKNAGGECIRLRYLAEGNEVASSLVTNCGVYDFKFKAGGKNGEGVYIGTAPEQRSDGKNPTTDPDRSTGNWIHHNRFDTQGNECVDIKEDSSENIVEYNQCTGQKDGQSAGLDSRGDNNTFRFNEVWGNVGAGVRLGGDLNSHGLNNHVYNNIIRDNQAGGIKIQRSPQGAICGNTMAGNGQGDAVGGFGSRFKPTSAC